MQSSTSTTISSRPRSITSDSSCSSVFGVGAGRAESFIGSLTTSGPVRERATRQRRPRPHRPVGGNPLIGRKGKERRLVAQQEIQHEAEEFRIGGALPHLLRRGAGGIEKIAGELRLRRDPAKGAEPEQLGRIPWQRLQISVQNRLHLVSPALRAGRPNLVLTHCIESCPSKPARGR